MRREIKTRENGNGSVVIAAGDNQELLAAAEILKKMKISVLSVSKIGGLEETFINGDRIIGIIVSRQFLGQNPFSNLGKMRNFAPNTPVVVTASKSSEKFEKNIRQIGVFYYMLEPYDREEFLGVITALLDFKARNNKEKFLHGNSLEPDPVESNSAK